MKMEEGLTDEDRRGNMILACTAVPKKDITIDA